MELVLYPDERLRQNCTNVVKKERKELAHLAAQMYPFMLEKDGAGLAAIQIGIPKRFFVIKKGLLPFGHTVVINPKIKDIFGQSYLTSEGCLSFPGLLLEVERFSTIFVEYEDWRGRLYSSGLNDFSAQVFQHEVDHLNGKVMTDHFTKLILSERV